jgi:hypothetical protein
MHMQPLKFPLAGGSMRERRPERKCRNASNQRAHKKSEKRVAACAGCRLDRACVHLSGARRWAFFAGRLRRHRSSAHAYMPSHQQHHYARGHRNRRVVRVTEGRRRIRYYKCIQREDLCFVLCGSFPDPGGGAHYAPLARIGRALDTLTNTRVAQRTDLMSM